jgi:hypothetical protein
MTDMEKIFVTDHIGDLARDALGVRGGHGRGLPAAPRRAAAGPRMRVGRWLIGVGEAIAGCTGDRADAADASDRVASPV